MHHALSPWEARRQAIVVGRGIRPLKYVLGTQPILLSEVAVVYRESLALTRVHAGCEPTGGRGDLRP